MIGYLEALDRLLSAGAAGLSGAFVEQQTAFVVSHQLSDGGFRGRQGGSDPYYTDFALRVLALLAPQHEAVRRAAGCHILQAGLPTAPAADANVRAGLPTGPVADANVRAGLPTGPVADANVRAGLPTGPVADASVRAGLLTAPVGSGDSGTSEHMGAGPKPPTVVECFSYLNAFRILRACGMDPADSGPQSAICNPQSAICRSLQHRPPSPYDAFLAALCLDCLGEESPLVAPAARAVAELQAADGGFRALPGEGVGQTSLTAAALGLLQMGGCLDEAAADMACAFLTGMQAPDGGLRAHPLAPCGDLLSTFTGFLTLIGLDEVDGLDVPALARFVRGSSCPSGGFSAMPGDEDADVEYTYYGLGTVCLLRVFALARQ